MTEGQTHETPVKVLHVGGWPLPLGGISVHVKRLAFACHKAGMAVEVFDPYPVRGEAEAAPFPVRRKTTSSLLTAVQLLWNVAKRREGWIHFHASRLGSLSRISRILIRIKGKKSYAVSIHGSFTHSWNEYDEKTRKLSSLLLNNADLVVAVNKEISELLINTLGIKEDRILTLPAYLPPTSEEVEGGINVEPELATRYHEWRKNYAHQVITTGAPRELYGFHLLLDSSRDPRLEQVGFVISHYDWGIGNTDQAFSKQLLEELDAAPNVFLVSGIETSTYIDLLRKSDVFLRATTQDGDSVALREAIGQGVRIVATDCVTRPDGAALFKTGSSEDLSQVLLNTLETDLGRCEDLPNAAEILLKVYRNTPN